MALDSLSRGGGLFTHHDTTSLSDFSQLTPVISTEIVVPISGADRFTSDKIVLLMAAALNSWLLIKKSSKGFISNFRPNFFAATLLRALNNNIILITRGIFSPPLLFVKREFA